MDFGGDGPYGGKGYPNSNWGGPPQHGGKGDGYDMPHYGGKGGYGEYGMPMHGGSGYNPYDGWTPPPYQPIGNPHADWHGGMGKGGYFPVDNMGGMYKGAGGGGKGGGLNMGGKGYPGQHQPYGGGGYGGY